MSAWYIKARSNANLLVVDDAIEQDFESLKLIKRFNDVGTWALQLRRQSSHLATFLPVLTSGVWGFPNGIIVQVDNQDGNGLQTVLTGPQLDIDVKGQQDSTQPVLITGACDNYWLSKRPALPCYDFPYVETMIGPAPDHNHYVFQNPIRYYKLSETSGTVAVDSSPSAVNGSYNAPFTLNQPGLIDDPSPSVKINGGFVGVTTTSLPAGNSVISVMAWGMLTATPGFNTYVFSNGTNVVNEGFAIFVDTSGIANYGVIGKSTITSSSAIALNIPHLFGLTWDGTTLTAYLDGQPIGTQTPGAVNTVYGSCDFGIFVTGGGSWTGFLAHCAIYSGVVSAAVHQLMYLMGRSRHDYLNYWYEPVIPTDPTYTATPCSTIIYNMVNKNAGALAQPTTAFTNWMATHQPLKIPNISLAADPVVGSTTIGVARMDKLIELIAALALQSNPELGFKLEQSGANLVFTIFSPTDLTSTAIFSRDLYGATGNILDYEWKLSAASANYIIAGGANPAAGSTNLTDRLFAENGNANSVAANGVLVDFLDYRQGSQQTTIQQAISGQLGKTSSIFQVQATMIDQPGTLYFKGPSGKGYDLGNKVTVLADGFTFQQLIRQISIDLSPNQPAIITPAIGTPINTAVTSEYNLIQQRLQALGITIATLNTNY